MIKTGWHRIDGYIYDGNGDIVCDLMISGEDNEDEIAGILVNAADNLALLTELKAALQSYSKNKKNGSK